MYLILFCWEHWEFETTHVPKIYQKYVQIYPNISTIYEDIRVEQQVYATTHDAYTSNFQHVHSNLKGVLVEASEPGWAQRDTSREI